MVEERRQGTLDNLLGKVGEVKSISETNRDWLHDIKVLIEKQNGRIGRLEAWRSFILGVTAIVVILIVPIFIRVSSGWLMGK